MLVNCRFFHKLLVFVKKAVLLAAGNSVFVIYTNKNKQARENVLLATNCLGRTCQKARAHRYSHTFERMVTVATGCAIN